jgi:hypothetical protein
MTLLDFNAKAPKRSAAEPQPKDFTPRQQRKRRTENFDGLSAIRVAER